jgi:catechol 2,3-dioxygenase-like lactoylglutathione lyase family enzyme
MKVLANRHVGILVDDINTMISFYMGLGMVLKGNKSMIEKGQFIENLLDSPGIELETAKLTIENKELPEKYWFVLELMTLNHMYNNFDKNIISKVPFVFCDTKKGVLDIAFTVDDIEAISDYVISNGGDFVGSIVQASVGFPAVHRYVRDPEGNILHIAENLK